MALLTEKDRLLKVLAGAGSDRPPAIAPGGMMSFLTSALLRANQIDGARAMTDAVVMAQAAEVARAATGIENLGVPFCLTVEAQALGATVSAGTDEVEPMLVEPALSSAREISLLSPVDPRADTRMRAVLEAIRLLKARHADVPIIGNLSGPATLATSMVLCEDFLRMVLKDKTLAGEVIDLATETICAFGAAMVASGADVIVVGDPTACGEIIGPRVFERLFLPEYQKIFARFRTLGASSVLHICGNVKTILPYIRYTGADAFSADSLMSIKVLRQELDDMLIMGNVSTYLLANGRPESITRATRAVLAAGVDIMAPSCGLDRSTPVENIKLMCQVTATTYQSYIS